MSKRQTREVKSVNRFCDPGLVEGQRGGQEGRKGQSEKRQGEEGDVGCSAKNKEGMGQPRPERGGAWGMRKEAKRGATKERKG